MSWVDLVSGASTTINLSSNSSCIAADDVRDRLLLGVYAVVTVWGLIGGRSGCQ
jgi:hypothetical protein